jgi:hypothetical protein
MRHVKRAVEVHPHLTRPLLRGKIAKSGERDNRRVWNNECSRAKFLFNTRHPRSHGAGIGHVDPIIACPAAHARDPGQQGCAGIRIHNVISQVADGDIGATSGEIARDRLTYVSQPTADYCDVPVKI